MGDTDKQYIGRLIDEYETLKNIRRIALEENAAETVKAIDSKLGYIKLKLQPLELPED